MRAVLSVWRKLAKRLLGNAHDEVGEVEGREEVGPDVCRASSSRRLSSCLSICRAPSALHGDAVIRDSGCVRGELQAVVLQLVAVDLQDLDFHHDLAFRLVEGLDDPLGDGHPVGRSHGRDGPQLLVACIFVDAAHRLHQVQDLGGLRVLQGRRCGGPARRRSSVLAGDSWTMMMRVLVQDLVEELVGACDLVEGLLEGDARELHRGLGAWS